MDELATLSIEEANQLVVEHQGWSESIARSVARAWNLDWRADGLDGAAMEALVFCSRRFQPARGIPFRGYARKRVHEAATEAARKSKGWTKSSASFSEEDRRARDISSQLLNVFPELRFGQLPSPDEAGAEGDTRAAIRHLLVGASIIAARQGLATSLPDDALDYKRLIVSLSRLEPVHQTLMWKVYWEGDSLRGVADQWETDELNVIREHQNLLAFLQKTIAHSKNSAKPKVRPGLRGVALKMKRAGQSGEFSQMTARG